MPSFSWETLPSALVKHLHKWLPTLSLLIYSFFKVNSYWSVVALQCWVSFCCTARWISYEVKWSEVAQLCLTLCDPTDCSLPGSSVHGIFQARTLEWGATAFSRGSPRPRDRTWVSRIVGRLFTIWATREALYFPLFMDFLPISVITEQSRALVLHRRFSLGTCFIHTINGVEMSIPTSQFIPPSFPAWCPYVGSLPRVSISVLQIRSSKPSFPTCWFTLIQSPFVMASTSILISATAFSLCKQNTDFIEDVYLRTSNPQGPRIAPVAVGCLWGVSGSAAVGEVTFTAQLHLPGAAASEGRRADLIYPLLGLH